MASDPEEEVVVIGGGPCAAVAARELVAAGLKVTMLDAGSAPPRGIVVRAAGRTLLRWTQRGFISTDRHYSAGRQRLTWVSSISQGGLSNFWTGAVPRFAPEDFTIGSAIDERFVWPIGYDDLVEFYELLESDLEITAGDRPIANVPTGRVAHFIRPPHDWAELARSAERGGVSIAPLPIARGSPWMVALRPREFTSHHCVVRPLERSSNFHVVRGARVIRLQTRAGGDFVDSATFVDTASGRLHTARGRAFVLAAGCLDTTEILLRSVSPAAPQGLGNTNGLVGRYFHDHPREWWVARLRRPLTALTHPMYISRAPYDQTDPLLANSLTLGIGTTRARLAAFVTRPISQIAVQVLGTMIPSDAASVSLAPGRAADDPESQLHLDFGFDEQAVRNIHGSRDRFRQIFADAAYPVELGPFHDLLPGSAVHYGGTARMHQRPEFGVVDAENRIHDAPNVVVVDASCFTTGPEKNPTLTAMAIAARAARRLAARLV